MGYYGIYEPCDVLCLKNIQLLSAEKEDEPLDLGIWGMNHQSGSLPIGVASIPSMSESPILLDI